MFKFALSLKSVIQGENETIGYNYYLNGYKNEVILRKELIHTSLFQMILQIWKNVMKSLDLYMKTF